MGLRTRKERKERKEMKGADLQHIKEAKHILSGSFDACVGVGVGAGDWGLVDWF